MRLLKKVFLTKQQIDIDAESAMKTRKSRTCRIVSNDNLDNENCLSSKKLKETGNTKLIAVHRYSSPMSRWKIYKYMEVLSGLRST